MKKIFAIIATILAVIPFIGVNALTESTNYFTYKKGMIVNFYTNENEETSGIQYGSATDGITTMVLEDKGANDKYVKVWMLGNIKTTQGYYLLTDASKDITKSEMFMEYLSGLRNISGIDDTDKQYFYNFQDTEKGLGLISLQELLDLFGVEYDASKTTYNITTDKDIVDRDNKATSLFEQLSELAIAYGAVNTKGFYTSTLVGDKIWIAEYNTVTAGEEKLVNGLTLKLVDVDSLEVGESDRYSFIGTGYVNKTADCHKSSYMCYVCGTTYTYTIEGTQDESCTAVPNVTNPEDCVPKVCYNCDGSYKWLKEGEQDDTICTKVDNVTSEANCVVSPKTGLESHILEFGIVAALCAIALLVVRRRDLFRTI